MQYSFFLAAGILLLPPPPNLKEPLVDRGSKSWEQIVVQLPLNFPLICDLILHVLPYRHSLNETVSPKST